MLIKRILWPAQNSLSMSSLGLKSILSNYTADQREGEAEMVEITM